MLLHRLVLHNFKRYREEEIRFTDGITGIVGNNGAGKSTIVEAIVFALYGLQGGTGAAYIVSSFAGPKERCEVRLDFSVGGVEYTVRRTYRRTDASVQHDAALFMAGAQLADGVSDVALQIRRILGMGPEDFRHTVFAAQKDLLSLLDRQPGKRKEWFMRVLGIDHLRDEGLAALKERLDLVERDLDQIGGRLQEVDEEATAGRLEETGEQVRAAAAEIAETDARLGREEEAGTALGQRLRTLEETGRVHLRLNEERQAGEREVSALRDECARLAAQIEACAANLAECEELAAGEGRDREVIEAFEAAEERRRAHERCAERLSDLLSRAEETKTRLDALDAALSRLDADAARLEALRPAVQRLEEVRRCLAEQRQKERRDRDLQARIGAAGERVRGIERSLASLNAEIEILEKKRGEFEALVSETADYESIAAEAAHMQEIARLMEEIGAEEKACAGLRDECAPLQEELRAFGDLDAGIKQTDAALGAVSEDLVRAVSGREALAKAQEETAGNIEDLRAVGPDSPCPTCHRPLHDHYDTLLADLSAKAGEIADAIRARDTCIGALTRERGELAGRRAALADAARTAGVRAREIAALEEGMRTRLERIEHLQRAVSAEDGALSVLGSQGYAPERHRAVQERCAALEALKKRCERLSGECAALPEKTEERERLLLDAEAAFAETDLAAADRAALGFHPEKMLDLQEEETGLEAAWKECLAAETRLAGRPAIEEERTAVRARFEEQRLAIQACSTAMEGIGHDEERHRRLREEAETARNRQERYLHLRIATGHLPALEERLATVRKAIAEAEQKLQETETGILALGFDPGVLQATQEEARLAGERCAALREDLAGNRRDLAHLEEVRTDLAGKLERARALKQQTADLQEEREHLKLARSLVSEYAAYLLGVVRGRLEGVVGEVLGEITDGRYDTVSIDEDFTPLINDMGADYPADRFSGGEQDDIAIALRIALSRYLAEVRSVRDATVLIFDEIFGSQDEERRANLVRALRTQEAHFPQIFLISHVGEVQEEFETTLRVEAGPGPESHVEVSE
ncbi:MAG: repair protein SbcC/Rad50 [Methanofollis sp.]|nr:repair protein SbcC/Rad50 [Methanofollis sp.]